MLWRRVQVARGLLGSSPVRTVADADDRPMISVTAEAGLPQVTACSQIVGTTKYPPTMYSLVQATTSRPQLVKTYDKFPNSSASKLQINELIREIRILADHR